MSQIDTIYSTFDQLTTWEQYRDLLIETLTASGYYNLDHPLRSEFTENHFRNMPLLAQLIIPLISTDRVFSDRIYSGVSPRDLLLNIHRSRELVINGLFTDDISGWTLGKFGEVDDAEWDSGTILLTRIDGANRNFVRQVLTVEAGGLYRVTVMSPSAASLNTRVGTTAGGSNLTGVVGAGNQVGYFRASGTVAHLELGPQSNDTTVNYNSVSIRRID